MVVMKNLLAYVYYLVISFLLSLRYRIKVEGFDSIESAKVSPKKGILFLANHPAEIDPCILLKVLWIKYRVRPIAIDYLFRTPAIRYLLKFVGSLSIPNFDYSSNSFKKREIDRTYDQIFSYLKKGENILIYPGGGLKSGVDEVVGGASGVHHILQNIPDVNVVLVCTKGLWGSSFSKALSGKTPSLKKVFLNGLKIIIKNAIFFTPRRDVFIKISPASKDFPRRKGRLEVNRYLEKWYNAPPADDLSLVSYSFWKKDIPTPFVAPNEVKFDASPVSQEIKQKVLEVISSLSKIPVEKIDINSDLELDLGLDSLDIAQLVVALKEEFGVVGINSTDVSTVESVLMYAAQIQKAKEDTDVVEENDNKKLWSHQKKRPKVSCLEGDNIPEIFLKSCDRMGHFAACVDGVVGEVSYNKLKLAALLLAQKIKKLPGKQIGILLPASVAADIIILATMFANKIPVMINWTLGEKNLRSVVSLSKIQITISAWSFLDRLSNVDLNGLDDQIVLLEDMRLECSLWNKAWAFLQSKQNYKSILRQLGLDSIKADSTAVILFTSGTESAPKGVPLSHRNIIVNQKDACEYVKIHSNDILLGVLPPFHSFGFSVVSMLPLLIGLRVVYYPNPTEGRRIASAIEKWGVNLLCLAPTFLNNVLRVASEKQLQRVRMIVLGAEKAPAPLFEKIFQLNKNIQVLEGYGITECSPILALNPCNRPAKGVGRPLPRIELIVVNPETLCKTKTGESGLILARGESVFSGYLNENIESPFVNVDGKQWYNTGDLGYLDDSGYLTLSGRLKRFVKIGGEMISLGAVEDVLLHNVRYQNLKIDEEHPPFAVCASEHEGQKSELHLFTTLELSVEDANKILRDGGMSNLIKIRQIYKVPYIPLLGSGKIDYRKLSCRLEGV